MSRSSIMRSIHGIVRQHAGRTDLWWPSLSRRGLIQAGVATLAGAAWPVRAARGGPPRIGIVGGGIAGLTAALTLHDAGLRCQVYESTTRLGGRMHSHRDFWAQGQTSEWCGEFIDTRHHVLRHLAQRFGLPLEDVNRAIPAHTVDTNYFQGGYYTHAERVADMQPVSKVIAEQISQVGHHYRYDDHNEAADHFDHMTAHDWIETYVPGGHASRLGMYLDLGMVSLNGLETPAQSALNIILPLHSDERFHVRGGNQRIPEAIARHLRPGTVQANWRLSAVTAHADQSVTLNFDTPGGPREEVFDHVILALPFSVLRNLDTRAAGFEARKQAMIQSLAYGTNSKLSLQFDQRYWNGRGAWPRASDGYITTDLAFQSTWDTSRAQPGAQGLLTNYTGGTAGAAYRPDAPFTDSLSSPQTAAYASTFLSQLEQVWPGGSSRYNGLATLSYPMGDENVRRSYSAFGVGQYTAFAGYGGVAQGRIHFAGEHTSLAFIGYMEGGAQSGQQAALEVIAAG